MEAWCRRVESNHQGLSTTDLQSAEPTALLDAGVVETDRNRTGIPRLQGGCSPVELRPRMFVLSDGPFPSDARERREVDVVDPGGSAPPSPDCEPGALLVERWARRFRWTHGESNPDFQNAILTSFLWTMSPWRSPRELNSVLLVFSQPCNR